VLPPPGNLGKAYGMSESTTGRPAGGHSEHELPQIDVTERGAPRGGQPQVLDRRLFMQLLVFDCAGAGDPAELVQAAGKALEARGVGAVVYEDVNDPRGIAVLTWGEDPAVFVDAVRPALNRSELRGLTLRPEFTMLGRSYSTGYEQDLESWLLHKPVETALNPAWPWAVWYPLRRSGAFAKLDPREQGSILREHGTIGRAYGGQDLAHDIRLACHGLDARDNEFVIGLIGKSLHPLSHIVQAMRKTRQTSEFISQMGPFFVGHAAFRSSGAEPRAAIQPPA
jgi:Chlorite dismutase